MLQASNNQVKSNEDMVDHIPSYIRSPSKQQVVVLDVNGVLCHVQNPRKNELIPDHANRVAGRVIWPRPGLHNFLSKLFQHFHVLIWSSMEDRRTSDIVAHILRPHMKPIDVMGQSACLTVLDGLGRALRDPLNEHKPIFFKCLAEKVWQRQNTVEQQTGFRPSPQNTLLIDDSVEKTYLNPPLNVMHVEKYSGGEDNYLLGVLLPWLMGMMQSGSNVPAYMALRRLGVPAMDDSLELAKLARKWVPQNVSRRLELFTETSSQVSRFE